MLPIADEEVRHVRNGGQDAREAGEPRQAPRRDGEAERRGRPGFVAGYMLWENDSDTAWLFAIFEDRESYDRNADDPAQNERYVEYRALMEDEPEWHDGEIETG